MDEQTILAARGLDLWYGAFQALSLIHICGAEAFLNDRD